MQLYAGSTPQFVRETTQNKIVDTLRQAFFTYYGHRPSPSEVMSWTNSLKAMALAVNYARLDQQGILVEYQLPSASKRIDCMLTGVDTASRSTAVIVELKQWERCEPSEGEYVVTWVAGAHRDVLHPSVQADRYRQYLEDAHTAFHAEDPIRLEACAYLHNYAFTDDDPLRDAKYAPWTSRTPTYSKDDVDALSAQLTECLSSGDGQPTLERVLQSKYRPSKKLMTHVAGVIRGQPQYVLLDEQLVVYDKIKTLLRTGAASRRKQLVLVRGGPGTGKSVIALNLLASALEDGRAAHYATGSKAFTETLRKVVGARAGQMFRYFNSYGGAEPGELDVIVMDEAHRIRETSANRFTPKSSRSGVPQIQELLHACKIAVAFIDDHQVVRPNEVGSAEFLRAAAQNLGADVHEFELDVQFRCGGSDAFVQWIENTLDIRRSATVLWEPTPDFDFQIVDTPGELDTLIRARETAGHSARLVGGFCWPWSDPRPDGTLVDDVVLPGFERPWNAKPDAGRLARGIPKASLWAYEKGGIDQVGCIYTAQGFEFDYVGVIFGKDLVWDAKAARWVGHPEHSEDPGVRRAGPAFEKLVKNAYRVLLSRGLKGCYVYFEDDATRDFVRSRVRSSAN